MVDIGLFFLSAGLLIGTARLLGELARRMHQPAVLGELLTGVLLGPTVWGTLAPETQQHLFPTSGPNAMVMEALGSLAIVLFLLVAGMEVDLSIVWRQGRSALKVGVLATAVPFVVGLSGAWFFPMVLGRQPDADPTIFALFVATAMAISALPVIAKTLMDLDLYRTDLGMIVVSAAIFNDLIGWTVFALILGMMETEGATSGIVWTLVLTLLFAGLMMTVGRWVMHRILPVLQAYTHYPGGVLGFAVSVALIGAATTEFIGIHAIFGAFIVGISLGASSHLQERTRILIDDFVSFVFAPLFFASIGLRVNFLTHFDGPLVSIVIAVATIGKLAGAIWGAKWGGLPRRDCWAVGFAMNARGAMEIILGTLALEHGLISERLFVALVVMAIVTSALSGPLIRRTFGTRPTQQLFSFLVSKQFIRRMTASTREEAIHELAVTTESMTGVDTRLIDELAWQREQIAATGIGNGVAIPHARLDAISEPLVVVGISEPGIPFDAPDGQLAHLIFLLVTPRSDPSIQLQLSASIARLFRDPKSVERILRAENYTEFLAVLKTVVAQSS